MFLPITVFCVIVNTEEKRFDVKVSRMTVKQGKIISLSITLNCFTNQKQQCCSSKN